MATSDKVKPQPVKTEAENKTTEKLNANPPKNIKGVISNDNTTTNHFFEKIYSNIKQVFASPPKDNFRKDIEKLLEQHESANISFTPLEKSIFKNSLSFASLKVEDVMVPRADIIAIDEKDTIKNLHNLILEKGHSRIPVYRETLDEPLYIIHIKDLLNLMSEKVLLKENEHIGKDGKTPNSNDKIISTGKKNTQTNQNKDDLLSDFLKSRIKKSGMGRKLIFVPPSMSASNLLLKMQSERSHLAIVVDEYGGTYGLVSIEDLIEEVVGNIEDEHDNSDAPLITKDNDNCYIAQARTSLIELERIIGKRLFTQNEFENYDTLGGVVFSLAGRVPNRGELLFHPNGVEFEVIDGDPRRIKRLKIKFKSSEKPLKDAKTSKNIMEAAE